MFVSFRAEGYSAYEKGLWLNDNPYPVGGCAYSHWKSGWLMGMKNQVDSMAESEA